MSIYKYENSNISSDLDRRALTPEHAVAHGKARVELAMDFSLPEELLELKERTERLVREEIIPCETDIRQTPHGPAPELRRELVAIGRRAGLLSPHVGA